MSSVYSLSPRPNSGLGFSDSWSNTTPLRGLVDAARARGADHDTEMAAVIDDHASAAELDIVVANVPPQLNGVADSDLGNRDVMTPDELRAWLVDLRT